MIMGNGKLKMGKWKFNDRNIISCVQTKDVVEMEMDELEMEKWESDIWESFL